MESKDATKNDDVLKNVEIATSIKGKGGKGAGGSGGDVQVNWASAMKKLEKEVNGLCKKFEKLMSQACQYKVQSEEVSWHSAEFGDLRRKFEKESGLAFGVLVYLNYVFYFWSLIFIFLLIYFFKNIIITYQKLYATCQELVSTVEQDENGHKILKEAKEESTTIYENFEKALKEMGEQMKKIGDQKIEDVKEENPKTPDGKGTRAVKSPEKK